MLSYRHLFHAGNFSDVFKHALLTRLLIAVASKEKPFCYLDTHAGIGRYDLMHPWARKAREYENGIGRIWRATDAPPALQPYLDAVRELNPDRALKLYPGSPLVARRFLRPEDRMVLVELNKVDHAELASEFAREKHVAVRLMDAYEALKAYLPPPERRGLVLIDSSFDRAHEFHRIVVALKEAHARWSTGIYAVWYPIMEVRAMRDFYAQSRALGHTESTPPRAHGARARRGHVHTRLRHARRESAVAFRRGSEIDPAMARAEACNRMRRQRARGLARA